MHHIRQPRNITLALLNHRQRQHTKIHADNAPPHTLPLALSSPARPIAAMPLGEQQPHTRRVHDSLLHREALLVVAAGDSEDVALELVADGVAGDFVAHAAVHEDAEFTVVFDFDELLRAVGGEGDVELHLDGWMVSRIEALLPSLPEVLRLVVRLVKCRTVGSK